MKELLQPDIPELTESTPEVKKWCVKWRLVLCQILGKDLELADVNANGTANIVQDDTDVLKAGSLTNEEFKTLEAQCLESLNVAEGRMAFAILLNRQRNADYGLELGRKEFFALVELVEKFCESVRRHTPIDVKAAKLVMIMTQSLYVRKEEVLDNLTFEEKQEFEIVKDMHKATIGNGNIEANSNGDQTDIKQQVMSSPLPKQSKLFLVDRIKDHILWKSEAFWKEAFRDSLYQELKKYPISQPWHSLQERTEAERRNNEIVFSQLAAITHNMKEFGMENSTIIAFLESQNLSPDKQRMLKATLGVFEELPASPKLPIRISSVPQKTDVITPTSPNFRNELHSNSEILNAVSSDDNFDTLDELGNLASPQEENSGMQVSSEST